MPGPDDGKVYWSECEQWKFIKGVVSRIGKNQILGYSNHITNIEEKIYCSWIRKEERIISKHS